METFNFSPNSLVPVTLAPDPVKVTDMNGWTFTSRPTVPYQKKFKVTLHGMRWFTYDNTGMYDIVTQPTINARLLEMFYEEHGVWKPFKWRHPHFGMLNVRFDAVVNVPEGMDNSGGLVDKFDLTLIHHDPAY